MAINQCPCRCGRRLRLSRAQMRILRERWRNELNLADEYDVPLAVVRHVRSIDTLLFERWWRGQLAREAS